MNVDEYLKELAYELRSLESSERAEILNDQEEYIRDASANGRSEQEVIASLGSPRNFAREILAETKLHRVKETKKLGPLFGAVIALLALAPLNLIFVLGPFIALIAIVMSLWIAMLSYGASMFAVLGIFLFKLSFYSVGLLTHLSTFFLIVALLGIGVLGVYFLSWLTRVFIKMTAGYLRWNLNFIRSRSH